MARLRLTEKKITAPWPLPLFPFLCGFPRYGILLSIKIAAFCAGRAGRTILRIGNKKGIFMERTFQKAVKQVAKYPILSIVAGAVALFSLVAFFFQLGNLFSVAGWFGDMVAWYMRDFSHLLGNLGSIFENGLYLLSCFFYVLQFLGTLALVGLLWGIAVDAFQNTKIVNIILLIAAIAASYIISPLYELANGLPLFSGPVAFLYRLQRILPMNLAALVIVVFLFIYLKKKKAMSFTLYLLIAGGIQVVFALFHILGSILHGNLQFADALVWLIDLASPVLFVFIGCMIESKLTGKPAPYVGKIITAVNGVQFTKTPAPAAPVQPAPVPQPAPAPAEQPQQEPPAEEPTNTNGADQ